MFYRKQTNEFYGLSKMMSFTFLFFFRFDECVLKMIWFLLRANFGEAGTDSKFEAKANLKALVPKSKQSLVLMYEICVRTSQILC